MAYNTRIVKLDLRSSAKLVVEEVSIFWQKAKIPTKDVYRCIDKVLSLHKKWSDLQKHSSRISGTHTKRETEFCEKLNDLFDIAHAGALDMMKCQEDKEFLLKQREKGRVGSMSGVDMKTSAVEKRTLERLEMFEKRRNRVENEKYEQDNEQCI